MGGETALIRGSTPQPPCTPSPTTPEKALLPSPYSSCQPPCLHGTPTPPPLHLAPASSWHLIMAPHRLCATLLGPLETPPHLPSTVTHCQSVLDPGGVPLTLHHILEPLSTTYPATSKVFRSLLVVKCTELSSTSIFRGPLRQLSTCPTSTFAPHCSSLTWPSASRSVASNIQMGGCGPPFHLFIYPRMSTFTS